MNEDKFKPYLGKSLSIGVSHFNNPNALFFYYGIVTQIDEDGVLLSKGDKEVFIAYDRIKEFHTPSGSGVWKKK